MSLSCSLRHCTDVQDMGEHTGVCPCPICPYPCLFDAVWTYKTRASTLVLAHVLYVFIHVLSTPRGHPGHERAHMCTLVSLSHSLRHRTDAQDTSEHISACPCPYLSLFDTVQTHRT